MKHCGNVRLSSLLFAGLVLVVPAVVAASDRMHPKVLAAFRDVVAEAKKSTVQVYCDGYRGAVGAIVEPSGYIATKASELKGKIECQLDDGRKLEAKIVGRDQSVDLAVLKIEAKDLPVTPWSESDAPAVGSWLATPVLFSDPPRPTPVIVGVLSVSPRKISPPSGALGVRLAEEKAARIQEVMEGSAAEKAGLQAGDLILKVNEKQIAGREQLVETIKGFMPGERVELLVKREGEEVTLFAVLQDFSQMVHGARAEFQNNLGGDLSQRRAGFPMVIQHDSILKPSECGGPICDLDGKVIGLNIARAGRVESYALPASVVRDCVKKLLETHHTSTTATAAQPAER
jgi:serine protease Do